MKVQSTSLLHSRHFSHALFTLAFGTLLLGCSVQANDKPAEPVKVPSGIPVDVTVIQPKELQEQLQVVGTIVANQQVSIVSELTRKVTKVNIKEGSKVKKGTLLFQLDQADLLAQLERLHQQEKLALLNEKRFKDLVDHEAIAQQDYDEVATNLKVLQAQISELKVTIDKTRITAPFDGQIGMVNTHVGAIVSTNTILTDIHDNSVIKIEFSVPEKYTKYIQVGSEQSFTTPASQEPFKSTIIAKAGSLSSETRTLLVRAASQNKDGKLIPGQSARINLSLNATANTLSVGSQVLIPSTGGYSVFVLRNGKAEATPVEIGQRSAAAVEIIKGLQPGDSVVTSNLLRLGNGAPVQVVSVK
jgi:membrane fusion protein, multidrug efflux system